jgi:type III restriction enzyme
MKLQFDSNQQYQLDAISAMVDIFKGQPFAEGDFEVETRMSERDNRIFGDLVVGNKLALSQEEIIKNLHEIQERNGLLPPLRPSDTSPRAGEEDFAGMNFSAEMETGTGKTYIYLRTIHELHQKYDFKKFIIVVPSIAIKEGVLKNLKITKDHFNLLYEKPEMDFYVYDPKKRGLLKNFATTNTLQILVINIDSFAKFNARKNGKNIIYQDSDWGVPIEYICAVQPIVIMDEPQNMDTDIRKKAIENLNPLCTLRYSATHKNPYNLVYRLDPVRAYDLGLVKKIEVDSIILESSFNNAYVELKAVQARKMTVSAKVKIDVLTASGVSKKEVKVRVGDDLYQLSGKKDVYKDGFTINEMDVANQTITFSNGATMKVGETCGGLTDEVMKFQIRKTVGNHLEKEKILKEKGIKVLSLFFIDRVANYREYEGGTAKKGKIAVWFEDAYNELANSPNFEDVLPYKAEVVHNGYFSQDKKGILKDTRGDTKEDNDTYALIMKEKEKLLSPDVPLRFIFSHSALREGWDNPNVFQICTLNETQSEMKKRQEIGRGLRLPVNSKGERVFNDNLNILTVVANESYEDFARALQTEIEDECGVKFEDRIKEKRKRKRARLKKGYQLDERFLALWEKIKQKTKYQVEYSTEELIEETGKLLADANISTPRLMSVKTKLGFNKKGVKGDLKRVVEGRVDGYASFMPDVAGYIQNKTKLTKDTIGRIIQQSGRFRDIFRNPQQFMDLAVAEIENVMQRLMIEGIKYQKIAGEFWEMRRFESEELEGYLDNMVKASVQDKTLYDYIPVDSQVERDFAHDLETREDVKFYVKLSYWFKIETPIGTYNPDWAIVFENDKRVCFVAETKKEGEIRESEQRKIHCGTKHFEQLDGVEFRRVERLEEIAI